LLTQLEKIITDFSGIVPEILLTLLLLVLVVLDLISGKENSKLLALVAIIGLVLVQGAVCMSNFTNATDSVFLFNNFLQSSNFSNYLKLLFNVSGIITIVFSIYSKSYSRTQKGEFYYILVAILLGLHLLVMSNNFFMMFISLELISIGSYLLTVFNFDKKGAEAGLKYILFGAFCTGIMLFGISLLYGATGSFDFPTTVPENGTILLITALFLTLTGLFFKTSAFPYHIWTPDVYQGAPMPMVAFFSVAPKAAALGLLYKIIQPLLLIGEVSEILTLLIAGIAITTMTIGNFSALAQKDLRRMLAYSTIAHAGFLLLVLISLKDSGIMALFFYLTVYLFMNFAAFGLVDVFAGKEGATDVNNFKGMGLKMPFLGSIFVLTMISLTGLPPTAGFYAKLFVFTVLWETYQLTGNQIFLILLFFGLLNTVVSLFYYLRIPYFLFFKKSETEPILTSQPIWMYLIIPLISLPLVILFFNPNWALNIIGNIKL